MKLLNLPIPIIASLLVQADRPAMDGPAWYAGAVATLFLVAYVLNITGKFPGASGERRTASYTDSDRVIASATAAKVKDIYEIVVREDAEKPGWRMVWAPAKETRDIREATLRFAVLADAWVEDREEWKHERADLQQRITRLEDIIRQQEHALRAHGSD